MLITKTCKMCGMEFEGRTNACYCSAACKREYETEYARRWREKNQSKVRDYQRNYWRRKHWNVDSVESHLKTREKSIV